MDLIPFLQTVAVSLLIFFGFFWYFARSAAILQNWADEHGYEILQKSHRIFLRGPFFFRTTRHQTVYRVTVQDKSGDVRTGWVACGSWWFGLCSKEAKVIWDEAPQASASTTHDRWLDGHEAVRKT